MFYFSPCVLSTILRYNHMQINKINKSSTNFTGMLNNKILLKGLEKISEHGTSFAAGTSLVMALGVRPLAILSTPNTEKENKQYASTNSICSGLIKFGLVEAIALPVENAVKKIDQNPQKYLKPSTIKNLQSSSEKLIDSKSYNLATQILKLGTGFLTAVPKSMLTIALLPVLMDKIFHIKKNDTQTTITQKPNTKQLSFNGKLTNLTAKGLGKILDNIKFQNFAKRHQYEEKNIAKHISAATDILLTSSFAYQTHKSKKIKDNRKKALIYNNVISTAITLTGGYSIDRLIKKQTDKFINKFAQINKADPKLSKYIEGINILRPTIIFAGIYYGILPVFSTYISDKIDKYLEKNHPEQNNPTY